MKVFSEKSLEKIPDKELRCPKCGSEKKKEVDAVFDGQKEYVCEDCNHKYFPPEEKDDPQ